MTAIGMYAKTPSILVTHNAKSLRVNSPNNVLNI